MVFTLALLEGTSVFAATVFFLMMMRPDRALIDGLGIPLLVVPALAVSGCYLLSFYYNELYELQVVRKLKKIGPRLLQALVLAFLILGAGYTVLSGMEGGKLFASTFLLVGALVVPLRAVSYGLIARRPAQERVLILGTGLLARKIADEIQRNEDLPYVVVGMMDDSGGVTLPGDRAPVPPEVLDEMEQMIRDLSPDRLVVAFSERRGRLPVWSLLSSCASGMHVDDGIDFYERLTRKLAIETLTPSFLIFHRALQKSRWQLALRRGFSVVGGLAAVIIAAPVMALVALLVKLDSPGPVFFVQERVGLRGRIFRLLKFRTMQGPPPENHEVWHRDDRLRLTRLGRWLRDLHLDELPQLLNVLKGDMDLVGPRPEMACNVEAMTEHVPYFGLRHIVRPGVTGWAQIKQGYSVSLDEVTEKMRYDLYYIKNMSLWFDLRIVLVTARIFLFGLFGRNGR